MFTMLKKPWKAKLQDWLYEHLPVASRADLDEAWQDGYNQDFDEVSDHIASKDDFIERQGNMLAELVKVFNTSHTDVWRVLDDRLIEDLRSYI